MNLPRIVVVGGGILGVRTTRELVSPGPDGSPTAAGVGLVTRRGERRAQLGASFGSDVDVSDRLDLEGERRPDVVVVARAAREQVDVARAAVAAGCHVVTTSDDPDEVGAVLELDDAARRAGVSVVVGATMSPGLSCLLAALAARGMDSVDEVHVARAGAAGPACARQRLRALRGTAVEWRDGNWQRRAGFSGRELCWFPDPVGARDCYRAELAEPALLVDAVAGLQRVSARLAANRRDRAFAVLPVLVGPPPEGGPGAIRVEVRGSRGDERVVTVLGAFDRPGVAGAATAAVAAMWLGGSPAMSGVPRPELGAHGLASLRDPRPLLAELARRGVRTAAFEGAQARPIDHRRGPDAQPGAGVSPSDALGAQVRGDATDMTTEREIQS